MPPDGTGDDAQLSSHGDGNTVPTDAQTGSRDSITVESNVDIRELQSDSQAQLLDAIDRLRQENIDFDINIPQIVVCGDQSSGKSSVLEAIAGVSFPISTGTTTRFATEVILRHASERDLDISLVPSPERSQNLRSRLQSFRWAPQNPGLRHLGPVIRAAGEHLRAIEPEQRFWYDRLRIQVSGPDQPHLTLVDLPGIIQSEDGANALPGDRDRIRTLIQGYLDNRRAIVLAVVDAQNDIANQEIFSLVRHAANAADRGRTLGVITKPDRLLSGSDLERNVVSLAKNEQRRLQLGWHVLRNLPHDTTGEHSSPNRDSVEHQFFSQGLWSQLDRNDVGIDRLRRKLQHHLTERITVDLPDLIVEVRRRIRECNDLKDRLGPGRGTVAEQRTYLTDVLTKLQRLIDAALRGEYEETEFSAFFNGDESRGLRDTINIESDAFDSSLRKFGQQYLVHTEGLVDAVNGIQGRDDLDDIPESQSPNFFPPYTPLPSSAEGSRPVTLNIPLAEYCAALAEYMRRNRGTNLPGMLSKKTVRAIFRQLSVPWTSIAQDYGDRCSNAMYRFLRLAVIYVAGNHTGEALLRECVDAEFDRRRIVLESKIEELLWPIKESHPITYNLRYKLRRPNELGLTNNACDKYADIARQSQFSDDDIQAAEALDQADVYYKIALDSFVDNTAIYAVERCLLHGLPDLIPPREIHAWTDAKTSLIASEPPEAREERMRMVTQAGALEYALRVFQRFAQRDTSNNSTAPRAVTSSATRANAARDETSSGEVNELNTSAAHDTTVSSAPVRGSMSTADVAQQANAPNTSTSGLGTSNAHPARQAGSNDNANTGVQQDQPVVRSSGPSTTAPPFGSSGGGFVTSPAPSGANASGSRNQSPARGANPLFGQSGSAFGSSNTAIANNPFANFLPPTNADANRGVFGTGPTSGRTNPTGGLFSGGTSARNVNNTGGLFSTGSGSRNRDASLNTNDSIFIPVERHFQFGENVTAHNIVASEEYGNLSPEELRLSDYTSGRQWGACAGTLCVQEHEVAQVARTCGC